MKSLLLCAMAASAVVLFGCSESVMIRSDPAGAKAYVNNSPVGTTPLVFSVARANLQPSYSLRLEKSGYESSDDTIRTRIAPGRMTAAFFTLGIVYLFKSPTSLVAPRLIYLQPSKESERDRRLGQDLREIQQLRKEGKITQEEFEGRRKYLLEEK